LSSKAIWNQEAGQGPILPFGALLFGFRRVVQRLPPALQDFFLVREAHAAGLSLKADRETARLESAQSVW
jgi:hypothetical protein